jgi:tryptophan 7-halogenase
MDQCVAARRHYSVTEKSIRSVVIVGGGTAGWMAAASLVHFLENMNIRIRLVESEQIGTVGVGEATIPPIMDFIRVLGIDENEIIRDVKATFKLGIAYRDWTRPGDYFFHPFGPTGFGMGPVSFNAYWLKMYLQGKAAAWKIIPCRRWRPRRASSCVRCTRPTRR